MALSDYILCCTCESKLLYDGDRGNRDWWEGRFKEEPRIECPDCRKKREQEPVGWMTRFGFRANPNHTFVGPETANWEIPVYMEKQ